MTGTVLEEGLRGSGGWLLDGAGKRFMFDYDPRGERATRDIVSRSIMDHILKGRASPNGGVFIAMGHLGPENVRREFKGMVERCADCGFDLAAGQVEVIPTAHYMMGGVVFEADCTTPMPRLFAAGEDTGGVHGANRLGGNGVANSTVFGGLAGDAMAETTKPSGALADPDPARDRGVARARLRRFRQATRRSRMRCARQLLRRDVGRCRHHPKHARVSRAAAPFSRILRARSPHAACRAPTAATISPGWTGSISRI